MATLDVRLDGFRDRIGKLSRLPSGAVNFAYAQEYLRNLDAIPLSLALPLTDEPYGDVQARAFFDNLLQERDQALTSIMGRYEISRDNIVGLLFHMGKDCAGALSVLPEGAPPVKVPGNYDTDYTPLSEARMEEIVVSLHRRRTLPSDMNDPSPLAGMQSKIALTMLPDGRFAEPMQGSGAPTTHILKVPDPDHPNDALYEATTMRLSRAMGFPTAEVEVVPFSSVDALLVTRYDRSLDEDGRVVRIHQEDFAQALGLPSSMKYERRGTPERRFDVGGIARVLNSTSSPAEERLFFIRATIFDLLVGNVDGHAKNFATLYGHRGASRLSPRYDVMPTRLDANLTDELAYRIGGANRIEDIGPEEFDDFLKQLGIATGAARKRLRDTHVPDIARQLASHLGVLDKTNLKKLADLIAANTKALLGALSLEVPPEAANRDAYVVKGGGWGLGS